MHLFKACSSTGAMPSGKNANKQCGEKEKRAIKLSHTWQALLDYSSCVLFTAANYALDADLYSVLFTGLFAVVVA